MCTDSKMYMFSDADLNPARKRDASLDDQIQELPLSAVLICDNKKARF